MNSLVNIENISISYQKVVAVSQLSLQILANQMVCLVGCNGAGKTSILNSIIGLVPHTGSVYWQGKNISSLSTRERIALGIFFIPEHKGLFLQMSVEENLKIMSYIKPFRSQDLSQLYNRFPVLYEKKKVLAGYLSGGEKQLLVISRVLLIRPQLLIIDEPTLGLSPQAINKIFTMLLDIKKDNNCLLLAEQTAYNGLKFSDYAYLIENGAVSTHGKSQILQESPKIKQAYFWTDHEQ